MSAIPTHPISVAVASFGRSPEWNKTMSFRHRWVHDQPSIVAGMGMAFKRRNRWEEVKNAGGNTIGFKISGGGGDEPEFSIDDVLRFVLAAFAQFVGLLELVVAHFEALLAETGPAWDSPQSPNDTVHEVYF
ncbi:MAG: hypothetical protein ACLQOO_31575 [Terriglobia bacterium]